MTLNLKKTLLAGTALVAVGMFVPAVAQAQLTATTIGDGSYDAGDAASIDLQTDPVIDVDNGAVLTFTQSIDDNDNAGSANNNVINITAGGGGVTINNGVTIQQTAGTGDVIASVGDIAIGPITIAGTVSANGNTQDAINLASLGAGNAAAININGGADITGVITGGAGGDTLSIDATGAQTSVFNGAINLGGGTDAISLTGTGTAQFQGAVTAEAVNIAAGGTVNVDGVTVTGSVVNTGTNNTGTLTTANAGTSTVTGNVGGTGAQLATISNTGAGALNIGGNAFANAITNGAAGSITVTGTTTGGALTNTAGGTVTLTGNASLTTVDLDGVGSINFDGTAAATTYNVDGTGTIDFDGTGTVSGNIVYSADGTVDFDTAVTTYTGTITNDSGSAAGDLALRGVNIVGSVGASGVGALDDIQLITGNANSFSSTVFASDIIYNGANTTTFNGAVTVTNGINFNGQAGTAAFADNVNLTGNVSDGAAGNNGTVNFAGTSTVTGSLGTVGNGIAAVNVNGASETVTVTGGIAATTTSIDGAGSTLALTGGADITGDVNFGAASTLSLSAGSNVSGTIANDSGAQGTGTLSLAGASALGAIGVDGQELGTITLGGTGVTVTSGAFQAADINNLNGNLLQVTGTADFDATQVINTTITDSTTIGRITSTGAATVDAGTVVSITVDPSVYVANGQTFTLINGTGGAGVAQLTAGNITDDSYLLSFSQTASTEDLVLTAARRTGSDAADTGNNANVLAALDQIGANGDATIDTIQANLATAPSRQAVNDILEALLPTVDGGATVRAGFDASVQSLNVLDTRLASLRSGDETGMVAGQLGNGVYAWVQGYGQSASQDARDGVDGYDSDTFGGAIGVDTQNAGDNTTLGLSVSYANTDVDSKNINATDSEVDSYQVSLYGDMDLSRNSYFEGMLAYAYNDINSTRYNVGGLGTNADADYSSDQYIAYAEMGRDYALGAKTTLTPSVLAHYQHIAVDDYTETGAAGASLDVDSDSLDILEFGVGAELSWLLDGGDGSIVKPALNAGYRYDVIGDNVQTTSSFVGAPGVSFETEGFDPSQSTFNAGASLSYALDNNWEVSAAYDYEFKSDYDSHSAFVRAGYKW